MMISQQDTRILKYLIETSHHACMPYSTEWHGSVSINMINIQIFLFLTNCQSFILPPRPLGVSAWMKYTGWCRIAGYYYLLGRLSISQKKKKLKKVNQQFSWILIFRNRWIVLIVHICIYKTVQPTNWKLETLESML